MVADPLIETILIETKKRRLVFALQMVAGSTSHLAYRPRLVDVVQCLGALQ